MCREIQSGIQKLLESRNRAKFKSSELFNPESPLVSCSVWIREPKFLKVRASLAIMPIRKIYKIDLLLKLKRVNFSVGSLDGK